MAKNIYNSPHKSSASRLLKMLSDADLLSLVSTVSLGRIEVFKRTEAIRAILVSSPDLEKFFSHRKLTSKMLFNFATQEDIPVQGNATRQKIVSLITAKWERDNLITSPKPEATSPSKSYFVSQTSPSGHFESPTRAPPSVSTTVQVTRILSTDLGRDFCEWFYSMINKIQSPHLQGDNFRPDVFCSNAEIEVFLIDGVTNSSHKAQGSEQAYSVINGMLRQLQFLFSPNLGHGLQTIKNTYGMIKVMCCGTLHKHDALIGIFEQEFGLVLSPSDKTWKIAGMKINLKEGNAFGVPALPPVEAFIIEC